MGRGVVPIPSLPRVACRSVPQTLDPQLLPGHFPAAHCSLLITKEWSNAEKDFPTGINKGYILLLLLVVVVVVSYEDGSAFWK